jgi:hypothetical protein
VIEFEPPDLNLFPMFFIFDHLRYYIKVYLKPVHASEYLHDEVDNAVVHKAHECDLQTMCEVRVGKPIRVVTLKGR